MTKETAPAAARRKAIMFFNDLRVYVPGGAVGAAVGRLAPTAPTALTALTAPTAPTAPTTPAAARRKDATFEKIDNFPS